MGCYGLEMSLPICSRKSCSLEVLFSEPDPSAFSVYSIENRDFKSHHRGLKSWISNGFVLTFENEYMVDEALILQLMPRKFQEFVDVISRLFDLLMKSLYILVNLLPH